MVYTGQRIARYGVLAGGALLATVASADAGQNDARPSIGVISLPASKPPPVEPDDSAICAGAQRPWAPQFFEQRKVGRLVGCAEVNGADPVDKQDVVRLEIGE